MFSVWDIKWPLQRIAVDMILDSFLSMNFLHIISLINFAYPMIWLVFPTAWIKTPSATAPKLRILYVPYEKVESEHNYFTYGCVSCNGYIPVLSYWKISTMDSIVIQIRPPLCLEKHIFVVSIVGQFTIETARICLCLFILKAHVNYYSFLRSCTWTLRYGKQPILTPAKPWDRNDSWRLKFGTKFWDTTSGIFMSSINCNVCNYLFILQPKKIETQVFQIMRVKYPCSQPIILQKFPNVRDAKS